MPEQAKSIASMIGKSTPVTVVSDMGRKVTTPSSSDMGQSKSVASMMQTKPGEQAPATAASGVVSTGNKRPMEPHHQPAPTDTELEEALKMDLESPDADLYNYANLATLMAMEKGSRGKGESSSLHALAQKLHGMAAASHQREASTNPNLVKVNEPRYAYHAAMHKHHGRGRHAAITRAPFTDKPPEESDFYHESVHQQPPDAGQQQPPDAGQQPPSSPGQKSFFSLPSRR